MDTPEGRPPLDPRREDRADRADDRGRRGRRNSWPHDHLPLEVPDGFHWIVATGIPNREGMHRTPRCLRRESGARRLITG
jgi:hypothetical protein